MILRSTPAPAGSAALVPRAMFWLKSTFWSIHGCSKKLLFDNHGLRLPQWIRNGQATLIKAGAGRSIYRVRLPELDLFVKHFHVTDAINTLHQVIRKDRAEKEFHLAQLLGENGVATIKPLGLGERRRMGVLLESYLLTEAIPSGLTLYEYIERGILTGHTPCPPSFRFELAQQLAHLAARIHELGIEHRDLHERNIIIQPHNNNRFRLFLLDLHELKIHKELSWDLACKELARMGRYFTLRTSRVDRLRFFKAYCDQRGVGPEKFRELVRRVESVTDASRADFWRRRDTRSPRKLPRVGEFHQPGARSYSVPEIPERLIQDLIHDPDRPFRDQVMRWWKVGRFTRVAEVEMPELRRDDTLVYKQFYFKGWHESLATLFRENQATRAWNGGRALLLRELPTPRPLMLLHITKLGLPVTSYLITERVPESQTIKQYLDRHLPELPPERQREVVKGVLMQAARLLRKMHERRVTHRDLKASNILVSPTDDLAKPKLWLIDLDGVQTWRVVPECLRLQNLTRFYVSFHRSRWITLTDRLRFLRMYLGNEYFQSDQWKNLWRDIGVGTKKKIARNLRQGRSVV